MKKKGILKKIKKSLKRFWLYFFCKHRWNIYNSHRYDITQGVKKTGEVTLTLYICKMCGKHKLIPSNRTYVK